MKNRIKIKIYNKEFSLQTEESQEYTLALAKKLDSQLNALISSSQSLSLIDACVLTSLSALDDCEKAKSDVDNLRTQIKDYLDDAGEARLKADELQKEIRELKAEIERLKYKK